jgi:hypothetical protein
LRPEHHARIDADRDRKTIEPELSDRDALAVERKIIHIEMDTFFFRSREAGESAGRLGGRAAHRPIGVHFPEEIR